MDEKEKKRQITKIWKDYRAEVTKAEAEYRQKGRAIYADCCKKRKAIGDIPLEGF